METDRALHLPHFSLFVDAHLQPQICRSSHSTGRKPRGTKEPLDERERGEWKSWLKTQHSKISKSLQIINAGEGVEKREPSYTVGGNAN